MKLFSSLSWQIIKEVILIYGIVAIFLTSFQLWVDYKDNLNSIKKNLSNSYKMFGPPISEAFYHVNTKMMEEIFKGVLRQGDFLGVAVYDNLANEFITRGEVNSSLKTLKPFLTNKPLHFTLKEDTDVIAYQHPIKIQGDQGEEKYFGNLIVFSNTELAFERIENTILLVFINSLIKAIVLLTMFLLIFNRLLIQPLTKINNLISDLSPKNLKSHRLDLNIKKTNELYMLQTRFNRLLDNLYHAQEQERILQNQSKFIAIGEMVGNIAHQWRQPLSTSNMIILNLLAKQEHNILTPQALEEELNKIEELNIYMSDTVEDFLTFFNPDKSLGTFKVKEIIESSLEIIKSKIEQDNISILVDVKDEDLIVCNQQELMQIFIILISNGIDSIIEKKDNKNRKIEINTEHKNSNLLIHIKDYGKGIDENILDRIFEPYFTSKHKNQGVGLGLYIAKMIIEKSFNGTIEVNNHPNGAIFTISFPKNL